MGKSNKLILGVAGLGLAASQVNKRGGWLSNTEETSKEKTPKEKTPKEKKKKKWNYSNDKKRKIGSYSKLRWIVGNNKR